MELKKYKSVRVSIGCGCVCVCVAGVLYGCRYVRFVAKANYFPFLA